MPRWECSICAQGWTCEKCGADNAVDCVLCPVPRPSMCWWNAQAGLERLPAALRENAFYLEGWAVAQRNGKYVIFAHGWMEVGGVRRDDTPHHHVIDGAYFEARRLPAGEAILAAGGPPVPLCPCVDPIENPGTVACYARDSPAFTDAYVEAERRAQEFCEGRGTTEVM